MLLRRVLGLLFLLGLPSAATAAGADAAEIRAKPPAEMRAGLPSEAAKAAMEAGIDRIFAFDFNGADAEFKKIEAEDPLQPYGDFGSAGAAWARFVYESQQTDPALEKDFEAKTDRAIERGLAWLKTHPKDGHALLCLGGSYGLRSRLAVIQNRWFRAVISGKKAISTTREAHKADPTLADAYMGIGMWEYYADVFPRFIKVLGKLLLGGDRLKGIEHLKTAATQGRYAPVAAQLLLIEIYTEDRFGAKDPAKALSMTQELRRRYPDSPVFHQVLQVCYYVAGDLDGVEATTQEYIKFIDAKKPYYPESDRARMHVALGVVSLARKKLAEARQSFTEAARMAGEKSKPSRWGVWGLLRLGETEDALGERAEAIRHYREVLEFPDIWGFHELAKDYLSHPFKLEGGPGQLPPP